MQLSGGNDGLNTVVPFESDTYQRGRPSLALRRGDVLTLSGPNTDGIGLHPGLEGLKELLDAQEKAS